MFVFASSPSYRTKGCHVERCVCDDESFCCRSSHGRFLLSLPTSWNERMPCLSDAHAPTKGFAAEAHTEDSLTRKTLPRSDAHDLHALGSWHACLVPILPMLSFRCSLSASLQSFSNLSYVENVSSLPLSRVPVVYHTQYQ